MDGLSMAMKTAYQSSMLNKNGVKSDLVTLGDLQHRNTVSLL